MNKFWKVIFLAAVVAGQVTGSVWAARSLVVGPSRFDLALKPGESDMQVIRVTNDGDEPMAVETLVEDLFVRQDGTPYYGPPSTGSQSCATWVRVNPPAFDLGPGETQIVRFNLGVPNDAVGSRYAVVFFRSLSPLPGSNSLGVSSKIGSIIVLDIAGTAPMAGDLTALRIIPPAENDTRHYQALVQMKNEGLAQFRVSGNIWIKTQDQGSLVFSQHFDPVTVVPGATRDITIEGPATLPPGEYNLSAEVEYPKEVIEGAHHFRVD